MTGADDKRKQRWACGGIRPEPITLIGTRDCDSLFALAPWRGKDELGDLETATLHMEFERSADISIPYSELPIQVRIERGEHFSVRITWARRMDNILHRAAFICTRDL